MRGPQVSLSLLVFDTPIPNPGLLIKLTSRFLSASYGCNLSVNCISVNCISGEHGQLQNDLRYLEAQSGCLSDPRAQDLGLWNHQGGS